MTRRTAPLLLASLAFLAGAAAAKVSPEEAARLGKELTPVGANPQANADGTIPPWTGGVTQPPASWKDGDPPPNMFGDDPVLFSIDASNVDQHADKLSPGQRALFENIPGYRMDVYRTRRSCGYPEWVYERTRENAVKAELQSDRIYLKSGWGTVLFPIPADGAEAIWNHTYSYLSEGLVEYGSTMAVSKSGDIEPSAQRITMRLPFWQEQVTDMDQAEGRSAEVVVERFSPPRLAGQVVLVHEMVNEQRRAWVYNPGQRRVRRAPTVAYDNPLAGSEALMTNDQVRMFTGIIDRFDWKLVGKQEMYIPYNVWALNHRKDLKYRDVLTPTHPRPDLIRFELHRVWVVEATVKKGKRHLYGKRVFYLDEDTWLAAVHDMYDNAGNLWRTQEAFVTHLPQVPTCNIQGTVSFDLVAGRYVADQIKTEERADDFLAGRTGRLPEGIYRPDALRRLGKR